MVCKVHLEGRVQHGVLYEVREVEPTAGVKSRLVKFLVDAGFISNRAMRVAVPRNTTCMITCVALHVIEAIFCGL